MVLGEKSIFDKVKDICLRVAKASKHGLTPDGGLIYETFFKSGHADTDRHWWVQAESVVGYLNAFTMSGNEEFLNISLNAWKFISENLVDRKNGEWYWSVDENNVPNIKDDKAGFWKCPYHNARMCLEIIERESNNL
jgi:mannobiose 2-epimerase